MLLACLLVLPAQAAAEETLPSGTVGTTYRHDFAAVTGGQHVSVATGALPAGLSLSGSYDATSDSGTYYIAGTPTAAGNYSFTVAFSDGTQVVSELACTISVAAAPAAEMPVITAQPASLTVGVGDAASLSVTAQLQGAGALSYLWYSASANDMSAMTAINRGTETGQTLNANTSAEGVTYYCVMVTNSENGHLSSVYSGIASVTVVAKAPETIERIEITAQPARLSYTAGETLDTAGMVVTAVTNKGSRDVTADVTCYPTALTTVGAQTITVNYGVYSASFSVTVTGAAAETPVITEQPRDAAVSATEPCRLRVTAAVTGTGRLSYQWYSGKTGDAGAMTAVSGGTSAWLSADTRTAGTTFYCVQVTNTENGVTASVTSRVAAVHVKVETPTILEQPQNVVTGVGGECELSVTARLEGDGELSYLWYSSPEMDMGGMAAIDRGAETSRTLRPDTSQPGTVYYCVLVMNADGGEISSVYSRVVSVSVTGSAAATATPLASVTPGAGGETPARLPGSRTLLVLCCCAAAAAACAGGAYLYLRKKNR